MVVVTVWLEMCNVISWLLSSMLSASSLSTYRPKFRSYSLDFYANQDYVRCLVHNNDESCISQVRMNRVAFFKLCKMLKNIGGLRPTRNMAIDKQVAMSVHIISHHIKNQSLDRIFKGQVRQLVDTFIMY